MHQLKITESRSRTTPHTTALGLGRRSTLAPRINDRAARPRAWYSAQAPRESQSLLQYNKEQRTLLIPLSISSAVLRLDLD